MAPDIAFPIRGNERFNHKETFRREGSARSSNRLLDQPPRRNVLGGRECSHEKETNGRDRSARFSGRAGTDHKCWGFDRDHSAGACFRQERYLDQ